MTDKTLRTIMDKVGPCPDWWVSKYFGREFHNHLNGLIVPTNIPKNWKNRLTKEDQAFIPWALWAGLRALQLDTPSKILQTPIELLRNNSLAVIDNKRLGLGRHKKIDHYLRIGDARSGWLTPGTTLEEEFNSLGFKLKFNVGNTELAEDWKKEQNINYQSMAIALDMETVRASNWIDTDPLLGMTCLLGPLSRRAFPRGERYRNLGFLGTDGQMSKLSWWRLATTARQGVGMVERLREYKLAPKHRSWIHMRRIQEFALDNWRQNGWIPIGLEYSGTSMLLKQLPHRYRPDLLMVTPDNQLVWYEYMRRPLHHIKTAAAVKYIHLPKEFLPMLSGWVEKPILFIYEEPHKVEQQVIKETFIPID